MNLEQYTQQLRERVGEDSGLGTTLKLNLGDDGVIFIDAKSVPNVVSNDNKEAACTITLSAETLDALTSGELAPTTAFMTGKLSIDGDMGVALKLQDLL